MKLGLVGHRRSIEKIKQVIDRSFSNIEAIEIEFVDIDQIPTLAMYLKSQEKFLDAIVFTGHLPYQYMNKAMISKIPWGYIERNYSQLTRALLKASYVCKYDILNISIDSYNMSFVEKVYRDIGITADLDCVYALESFDLNSDLLNVIKVFHLENYVLNNVSVCITGISGIYEFLVDKDIPCLMIEPTDDLIKETIQTVSYKYKTLISEERHLVALAIEIDSSNEFSVINENEYQLMLNKMKVTEEVYKFAQRIQAAVVETGLKRYLLFSTKNILDNETKNMKEISILQAVAAKTAYTVSLGIGYGVTAREAVYNANLGMIRSFKSGGNKAYIVEKGKFIGPIAGGGRLNSDQNEIIDSTFQKIANETGLSVNRIFSIHCLIEQYKKDCFTSKELAEYLNITSRSVNRIINRLAAHNYAQEAGKRVIAKAGRPSRIIRFNI